MVERFVVSIAALLVAALSVSNVRAEGFKAGQCYEPKKFTALLKDSGYKLIGGGWETLRSTRGATDVEHIGIWHNADAKSALVMRTLDDRICIVVPITSYEQKRSLW